MAEVTEVAALEDAPAEEEGEEAREVDYAKLDDLGQELSKTRSHAIAARQACGIEDLWLEDEEFYEGIDDANRHEAGKTLRTKPPGQAAAETTKTTRSNVFPNITGPFVEAAAARIADMLLPTDDRSWALKPTPVPELVKTVTKEGRPAPGLIREAAKLYPGNPQAAKTQIARAVEAANRVIAEAKEKADRAQTRIEDWHVECQWHAHVRLVIEDAARIGTGILKGPIPIQKKVVAYVEGSPAGVGPDGAPVEAAPTGMVIKTETKPGSKWIDPWCFFPDPACGENIHNGSYTWEYDHVTRKQLRELKGGEGYIDVQIDACIAEGPALVGATYKETPEFITDEHLKDKFQIWYYHGTAEKEDLEAIGCDCSEMKDPHLPVMLTMVNNRVIRASLNPLDTGQFPYDVMVWRRRAGYWAGSGVARQIRTPQRIITAAARNLMDNAGLAAGPMLVYFQGKVVPADGTMGIGPRKVFYITADTDSIQEAEHAIGVIKVDMLVDEMIALINLGLQFAEHVTGLPMLLQGQQGKAPDTVGGMTLLNNNASAVLRRLARLFDDRITEPHVRRYYHWLLQHGEDDEKGDYCIDARGSSALVERDLQNQEIAQMGAIVTNPVFGLDPKKWAQEWLKSRHFDPKRFEFDDEKWQQIVEGMSKGPQDPRAAVAQLNAQAKEAITKLQGQIDSQILQLEQKFEGAQAERDREVEVLLAMIEKDVIAMGASNDRAIATDQGKVKIFDTITKVRAQMKLAHNDNVTQLMKPPTEPAGRAPAGQAFQG